MLFGIFKGSLWTLFLSLMYMPVLFWVTFVTFCHWADDSAGGPGVPEVIYNPVAIYGMMICWVSFNLGMASDIQYTTDNHA